MTPALELAASALAGALLGLFFFGTLWATVQRLAGSGHPATLMVTSFVLRVSVLMAGLMLITAGDWLRLLAALAGVLVARWILIRRVRPVRQVGARVSS